MTKRTKGTYSTDSAARITSDPATKEIRKWNEHDEPLSRSDGHNPYWCGGDNAGQAHYDDPCWSCISFLHEAAEKAFSDKAEAHAAAEMAIEPNEIQVCGKHIVSFCGNNPCDICDADRWPAEEN
jgi:hypothetical protein